MSVVSMKQLLEAGVHFGHQTRRWNPKMAPYIFTERNGIYIIDLQQTIQRIDDAYDFIRKVAADGEPILFVGTKKQAQAAIKDEALRSGMYFVNERWLGGMLTNYKTISKRIARLAEIREMEADGTIDKYAKKEALKIRQEADKLEKFLGGIKDVDYIIPANDDAIRAVKLITSAMADAVIEAKQGESFDASEVPAEEAETEAEA